MAKVVVKASVFFLALVIGAVPAMALPVAVDDLFQGNEDESVIGNLLSNDSGTAPLVITSHTAPAGVTVDGTGGVSYIPPADTSGEIVFTYTIQDSDPACSPTPPDSPPAACVATATVTLRVLPVNDTPTVAGSVAPIVVDEDAADTVVDVSTLFTDPDILTSSDSLSLSVSATTTDTFASASVSSGNLVLVYADNGNGSGSVTITATDTGAPAETVDYVVSVTVNAVNDEPTLSSSLPDLTLDEDAPRFTGSADSFFDDVDILTNGDVLTFSVSNNTNPVLFSSASFADDQLVLVLAGDQNGVSELTIRATDISGAFVEDTLMVNVTSINDIPLASDDVLVIDEDTDEVRISVLDNDYLAEQPTVITAVTANGEHTVVDAFEDPQVFSNSQVTIDGDEILYEPAADFYGIDTFSYTITDSNGDISVATVSVTVNEVNDPPLGVQLREFRMFESQSLTVDAASGLFLGSYDVDAKRLDEFGLEVGSVLVAQIETLPPIGVLVLNSADGSFVYTPPINTTGVVEFSYRLFDNLTLSPTYLVRIEVDSLPPPPEAPPAGEVAAIYNLSQVPLEQSGTVPPNVMVVMDDSGSMDWNVIVDSEDENGGFLTSNEAIASRRIREGSYTYLWDLDSNAYPPSSRYGRILPTEDALTADGDFAGNNFGVWRARTSKYNKIYYDPEIFYEPWIGQDEDNEDFHNADPSAIRLDPVDPDDTFPMLELHSYRASNVPNWSTRGGNSRVAVDDLYIPYYYETSASLPLEGSDTWDRKVVIEDGGGPFPRYSGRDDCDPLECTYEQEIQNFANWFQYYRSREYVTKGSIGAVIAEVQDIRVGYETISATTSEDIEPMNDRYDESPKKALLDNIYSVDSYGGTPLRQALGRASRIMGCQVGSDCPALDEPEGQCQQNFVLMFSDGYWNGGTGISGNPDGDRSTDFDGGRYEDDVSQTLADVAMFYYENDLFDDVADGVPVSSRDIAGAPEGTFDGVDSMRQHVKTFAIAFGVSGTFEPSEAESTEVGGEFPWTDPFAGSLEKVDDMVHAALNGRGSFLSAGNPTELKASFESAFLEFTQAASSASAAAFNSTSLRNGTLLYRGFYDLRDRTGEVTATEVDSDGVLASTPFWRASDMLNPDEILPSGRILVTYNPDSNTGVPFRYGNLAPVQQATLSESQVDYLRGGRSNEQPAPGALLRERPAVNGLLGPVVNSSPVFVGGPGAINRDQAPYPTDNLYSTFAASTYDRMPVVYVGSNDGMLHGIEAATGLEVFGYVPNKILDSSANYSNKLNEYTSPFYFHNYYVDLSPSLNDVYMRPSTSGTKQWMTTLIGGLGAGGKGFFALNVNDPDTSYASEATAANNILWEFTDEDDTYPLDTAGTPLGGADGAITDFDGDPVKDLGYAISLPVVQMTNAEDSGLPANKEWAAIFGNGANSTSGIAKLFVLFLDRGLDGWDDSGDFVKIDTGFGVPLAGEQLEGYPNALGSPTAIDVDLNGTVDYVYAGDRLGNLFRFDLTSDDPDDWDAVRLFTATYNDGTTDVVQPIQSKPLVVKNPDGIGFIVIFGTGSLLTSDDSGSTEIQSIYGIWDRLTASPATADSDSKADRLVEQTITNVVDDSTGEYITRRIVSRNSVEYLAESDVPGTYGWYMDLDMERASDTLSGAVNPDDSGLAPPEPQFPGEKAVRRLVFRNGNVLTTTVLPASNETSCLGARPGSILLFNAFNGGDSIDPVVDFNRDGYVTEGDLVTVDGVSYSGGLLFNQTDLDGSLVDLSTLGGSGETDFLFVSGGNDTEAYRIIDVTDDKTGRLSWIELDDAD